MNILCARSILFIGVFFAGGMAFIDESAFAKDLSTICKFTKGPKAGQFKDYAPMTPIAVGSSCQDGAKSSGIVIAQGKGLSTFCHFTKGPQKNNTLDYAPQPPIPVGNSCQDGKGSFGYVVVPQA